MLAPSPIEAAFDVFTGSSHWLLSDHPTIVSHGSGRGRTVQLLAKKLGCTTYETLPGFRIAQACVVPCVRFALFNSYYAITQKLKLSRASLHGVPISQSAKSEGLLGA